MPSENTPGNQGNEPTAPSTRTPFFVGVTGGSGSGKTYFIERLRSGFSEAELCLISQDNYYRPLEAQPLDERGLANFDTPESIDYDAFEADVRRLQAGQTVERPEYTFNHPTRKPGTVVLRPAPLVVVEGIFVMHFPRFANMLDLKVFIDAKTQVKFRRRIERDRLERGQSLEDVLYRFERHAMPSFERYIGPQRDAADLVVNNNRSVERAVETLTALLRAKLPQASQPLNT